MPKYAQFDGTAPNPSPVLGWFDTDILHYPNLPSASNLVEATDSEWAIHFNNPSGWSVTDGALTPPKSD